MKLAVWLVEQTSEHTPHPWEVRENPFPASNLYRVVSAVGTDIDLSICQVENTAMKESSGVGKDASRWDTEAMANARLIVDAPAMLRLLARSYLMLVDYHMKAGDGSKKRAALIEEVVTLIGRHVRTGCAPVDAESHRTPTSGDGTPQRDEVG